MHIVNLYNRDNSLTTEVLKILAKYKRIILIGDFNAKHKDLLPHTQKTQSNVNGRTLLRFLEGEESTDEVHNPMWKILNSPEEDVYTHTNGEGGWAQIDFILCTPDLEGSIGTMEYDGRLRSDHVAIAVPSEGLFSPLYKVQGCKEKLLWDKFDSIKYKAVTEAEFETLKNLPEWKYSTTENKIKLFTEVQSKAMSMTLPKANISNKGKPIPFRLLTKIRRRRSLKSKLKALVTQKRRRDVAINDVQFPPPIGPEEAPLWDNTHLMQQEVEATDNRREVSNLDKQIKAGMEDYKKATWEGELKKLASLF